MFLHADSEDSDQTGWMPRLMNLCWVHRSFCWFCHAAAHLTSIQRRHLTSVQCREFYLYLRRPVLLVGSSSGWNMTGSSDSVMGEPSITNIAFLCESNSMFIP